MVPAIWCSLWMLLPDCACMPVKLSSRVFNCLCYVLCYIECILQDHYLMRSHRWCGGWDCGVGGSWLTVSAVCSLYIYIKVCDYKSFLSNPQASMIVAKRFLSPLCSTFVVFSSDHGTGVLFSFDHETVCFSSLRACVSEWRDFQSDW